MKVTIKNIAREANVSISTISLVLNNKLCRVSMETRDLIPSVSPMNIYGANQAISISVKNGNKKGCICSGGKNRRRESIFNE